MTPLPLSGIRIIEPGQVWALPYAISPLAAYGAEVIKVESAVRPDSSRASPQPDNLVGEKPWNDSGTYHEANRNKLGISLDLNTRPGKELFKELVSISDVVAQNFPPRVMRNFGLDYPILRQVKPDIIVLDSTAYGSSGPWQNYIGYGSSLQAVTGLTYLTGYEDGGPVQGGILFNDTLGAVNATYAILLALAHRERTGQGQWIDLSQYEAGVAHLGEAFMEYEMNGVCPPGAGTATRTTLPTECTPVPVRTRGLPSRSPRTPNGPILQGRWNNLGPPVKTGNPSKDGWTNGKDLMTPSVNGRPIAISKR